MSDPAKKRNPTTVSPKGIAVYPWLNKPDTKEFDGKPSAPKYKVGLRLLPTDPILVKIIADAKKLAEDFRDEEIKRLEKGAGKDKVLAKKMLAFRGPELPVKDEIDKDSGEGTGFVIVSFYSHAEGTDKATKETFKRNPPAAFDAGAKKYPEMPKVFGGSELKVNFELAPYVMVATEKFGVAFRMNSVQILRLAKNERDAASYGFGVEEGDAQADDSDAAFTADTPSDTTTTAGDSKERSF